MTLEWYDKTLSKIGKGLMDLNNLSDPKIVAVTSGYVFSQAHEFLSDISSPDRVAVPASMTNVVFGATPAPTDYFAYYTMDDADITGATIEDQSGNGHDATMVNTPTTGEVGKFNESILFESANSEHATIVDHADFKPANITISAWVSRVNAPSSSEIIFSNRETNGINIAGFRFFLVAGGASINIYNNTTSNGAAGASYTHDGSFRFLVGTFDGSNVKFYLDGILKATGSWANPIDYTNVNDPMIGAVNIGGTPSLHINSKIDDLKVFDRAITPDEVTAMFNAGGTFGTDGWLDADDPLIIAPTVDDTIEAFVMLNDSGVEATSPILFYASTGLGLPYLVDTTANITVQLGPNGIAKL